MPQGSGVSTACLPQTAARTTVGPGCWVRQVCRQPEGGQILASGTLPLPVSGRMKDFDHSGYSRQLSQAFAGLEFDYEGMEEELTCPVCLELYADPLLMPCSHSVCKKCLQDIYDSKSRGSRDAGELDIECPSCRKTVTVSRNRMSDLPKNLALENVVIRYTEERSKSIRKSLSLDSPVSDLLLSSSFDSSATTAFSEFPSDSKTNCHLCEKSAPDKAAWYCVQCEVAYCHACFAKFHPRRGPLARHKIQQPPSEDAEAVAGRGVLCADHEAEEATLFCDKCKVFVCSLCVCEGEGKHTNHKMFTPDKAGKLLKDNTELVKKRSDVMLAKLSDQKRRLENYLDELKDLQSTATKQVDQQYTRLVADLTEALRLERASVLQQLAATHDQSLTQARACLRDNDQCGQAVLALSQSCQGILAERHTHDMLTRAAALQPLMNQVNKKKKEVEALNTKAESLVKDKSSKIQLQSSIEQFRKGVTTMLTCFQDVDVDRFETIVPVVKTPSSSGRAELAHRSPVQNKYLITWGFSSTTFTGEELTRSATWTVTIERNSGHSHNSAGYLFGVGIASEDLSAKELVGTTEATHGVLCSGGTLWYSQEGKQENLAVLESLPISVTVSVSVDHPRYTVLTYRLASSAEGQGLSLEGRRVIRDGRLKDRIVPVFTVSQRVKLLFPTYV